MTAGSASIHRGSSAEDGACGIEAHVMLGQPSTIDANCANTARFWSTSFLSVTGADTKALLKYVD